VHKINHIIQQIWVDKKNHGIFAIHFSKIMKPLRSKQES